VYNLKKRLEVTLLKKVILLGDSIRQYYQEEAIKNLGSEYTVWQPGENCRFARFTLNSLRFWLPECPNPDIIHWNNGLWDTAQIYEEDGSFTPIEEYISDMKKILRELKKTGAKVIFATITPVNPKKELDPKSKNVNSRIAEYNRRITEVMKVEGVPVNDLYSLVYPNIESYICEDYVHLTQAGKEACGKAVADAIKHVSE
jgi:Lysophospholipase L1 and related esterases